jgi:uncharacterized protein YhfF
MNMTDEYWKIFCKETNRSLEGCFTGTMSFEKKNSIGDEQILLILNGKKTVLFSPFPSYSINREPLPVSGEMYVLMDRSEQPRGVIEIVSVSILPFNQITWDMARNDGENENMSEWREKQLEYFEDEGDLCGFVSTDSMMVVYEQFQVLYRS